MKWTIVFAFLSLLAVGSSIARSQPVTLPATRPGDQLEVFLATFGPGSDPWEKFGHDAILISDTDTGEVTAYNWGVFDFGEGWSGFASFSWHFLQGRLLYSMQSEPADEMFNEYVQSRRSILLQKLNLTSRQKLGLRARLIANDTDANRYYLYDYFKKNCATMARDAIDQTINGRAHAALDHLPTGTTYRWHDRRTCADVLWLYLFLDYALGHPIDHPLSAWEECFLPGKLAERLVSVKVSDEHGNLVPLIGESKQLNAGVFPEREVPPASFVYWLAAAGVCAGILLALLGAAGRRIRLARWIFDTFAVSWSLVIGSLGVVITFAWFTNHAAAKWNENIFQGNPLSLLLILLIPFARRWRVATRRVTLTVLALSIFGLLAKLTPWAWQGNGPILALAVPIHAGVAWGIVRRNRTGSAPDGR